MLLPVLTHRIPGDTLGPLVALPVGPAPEPPPLPTAELLVNGGAEEPLVGGEIPGWTKIVGDDWQYRSESPAPHSGENYFFPGQSIQDRDDELRQDVDVSAWATQIDAEGVGVRFSGFVRSFSQSSPDPSRVVIEARDGGGELLDTVYDSGQITSTHSWFPVGTGPSPNQLPTSTRTVRVRLISTLVGSGETNNDGYYDTLSLTLDEFVEQEIEDALLLLDASESTVWMWGENRIAAWHDLSGNGNHFVQGDPDRQPLWVDDVDGGPAVECTGTVSDGTFLVGPAFLVGAMEAEVFVVMRALNSPGANTGLWRFGTPSANDHYSWTNDNNYNAFGSTVRKDDISQNPGGVIREWHILRIVSKDGDWRMEISRVLQHQDSGNSVGWHNNFRIGASAARYWQGYFREVRIYSPPLSAEQADAVYTELETKWGIGS